MNKRANQPPFSQLVDIDKELDITVNFKIRQTCAFRTDCNPVELTWQDGEGLDEQGFFHSSATMVVQRTQFEEEQEIQIGTVSGKPFGARV